MKHNFPRLLCFLAILMSLCVCAHAYEKLERGDTGSDVLAMQQALKSLGYSIATDGNFGYNTLQVVKSFQSRHGLVTDGVAGDKTLSLLYSLSASSAPVASAAPQPTIAPSLGGNTGASGGTTAKVVTTGGSLNLRFTADSAGKVLTTIPNGATINITQRGATWCATLYNGFSGYVMTRYLSFATQTPTLSPTAVPTVAPGNNGSAAGLTATVVTTGGSLNLRAEAKSGAKVLTTIPNGAQITVTARGTSWCAASYGGYAGYVMSSFLYFGAITPTAAPTALPTTAPGNNGASGVTATVVTTGGSLNLRADAKSGAKVLTTIPNGTQITVTARGTTWCATLYNGFSGYVMTSFLAFSAGNPVITPTATPAPLPTTAPSTGGNTYALVTTSGGSLNLRAEASSSARVLTNIPNAATLTVYQRGTEWCSVSYAGTSGYVMTKFLTFISGGTTTTTPGQEEDDPSTYSRTLKKGMTGEDVNWVQSRLLELGYTLSATGTYDDKTISAVKAFQGQNGLSTDGLAGSQTFAMLRSDNARRADDTPLNYTTLRVDDQGEAVTSMQKALQELGYNVSVNGQFDVATHNAVVACQQRNGLVISGIADALTRQILHSGNAKPYSTPVEELEADAGKIAGPSASEVKLLHWFNEIKPTISAGQSFTVYDPNTGLSWTLKFYSLGRHADSQPATWRDTQIMNRSFGSSSWTIHPVYVLLPTGQWTMATMHNRPHLYGSINDNGFGGHLCVHFLRDMDECTRNDPNYGVNNQKTLRSAWKALTGQTID